MAVGATVEEMLALGLRQVGKDFPVFIDKGGTEFSLARRSRNGGIADFGPEVTLKEDLAKRDLTINAMALWVQWYKRRGRTQAMWLLFENDPPRQPTEAQCLLIVEYFKQQNNNQEKET